MKAWVPWLRALFGALSILAALFLLTQSSLLAGLGLVGAGVLLSVLLVGAWDSWCLIAAAGGAIAFVGLAPFSPSVAAACFFGAVYLPRAIGARTLSAGAAVLGMAGAGGAAALLLSQRFAHAIPWIEAASFMVGVVLVAAAALIDVDEYLARSLRLLARGTKGSTRRSLLRAVALRRRQAAVENAFSTAAKRRIARAWEELLLVARRQNDRSTALGAQRIHAYVRALASATRAARESAQLSTEIGDDLLVELWSEEENLRANTEAWRDLRGSATH